VEFIDAHRDKVVEGRKIGFEIICAALHRAATTPSRRVGLRIGLGEAAN
jgi:hypothetical protein